MFQQCFSRQKKSPRIFLIFRLIRGLIRTQSRDRTGMEVNPLVFETSASTNSAIWAFSGCKSKLNFGTDKDFLPFTEIILQLLLLKLSFGSVSFFRLHNHFSFLRRFHTGNKDIPAYCSGEESCGLVLIRFYPDILRVN